MMAKATTSFEYKNIREYLKINFIFGCFKSKIKKLLVGILER
jgi:hypothetical protein